ncbi:hypothetical protein [Siccibacter turicensis]|uniref:hypothetical protein n=1 Tax=Siccibacter turicensis TaxID=357233 RepID=UPI000465E084|nr:hypothetical protein [Siccibacter turicensis]
MWREAILKLTEAVETNCSVTAAHPWVYGLGQQTDNGAYLSPANAVAWFGEKLGSVTGDTDVVILLATGQTQEEFLSRLDPLTDVFPVPAFTQVSRLARSAAELATVKMQKPAKAEGGPGAALPLSVPTARAVSAAAAIAKAGEAKAMSMDDLKKSLTEFSAKRASLLADIAAGAGDVSAKSARGWVFTASGNAADILRQLMGGIPARTSVYCAAIMLTGKDLSGIRSMIHDDDSYAGT